MNGWKDNMLYVCVDEAFEAENGICLLEEYPRASLIWIIDRTRTAVRERARRIR